MMKYLMLIIVLIHAATAGYHESVFNNSSTPSAMLRRVGPADHRSFSGPIVMRRQKEIPNDGQFAEKQMIIANPATPTHSNNLSPIFNDIKKLLDEKRMETAKKVQQELTANIYAIRENIPRPKGLKQFFKRYFEARKTKNYEKKLTKNQQLGMEISDTLLDESNGGPCEKLLPACDKTTGKLNNDYELRLKVRENLDDLTGWAAVKEAICSAMESPQKSHRCNIIAEKMDFIEKGEEEGEEEDDDSISTNGSDRTQSIISEEEMSPQHQTKKNKKTMLNKLFLFKMKKNEKKSSGEKLNVLKEQVRKPDIVALIEARRSLENGTKSNELSAISVNSSEKLNLVKPLQRSKTSAKGLDIVTRSFSFRNDKDATKKNSQKKLMKERKSLDLAFADAEESNLNGKLIDRAKNLPLKQIQQRTKSTMSFNNGMSKGPNPFIRGRHSLDTQTEWSSLHGRQNPLLHFASGRNSNKIMARRSFSVGSRVFGQHRENVLCTARWEIVRHGLYLLNDDHVKEKVLQGFRRVNCILQLVILQQTMLNTKYYHFTNTYNFEDCKKFIKTREIVLSRYRQSFLKEKDSLLQMLDRLLNEQLGDDFAQALAELCDKVIAHWSWLYEQNIVEL